MLLCFAFFVLICMLEKVTLNSGSNRTENITDDLRFSMHNFLLLLHNIDTEKLSILYDVVGHPETTKIRLVICIQPLKFVMYLVILMMKKRRWDMQFSRTLNKIQM